MVSSAITLTAAQAADAVQAPSSSGSNAVAATPTDEVIQLSVFEVTARSQGRYQMHESTSGGRVRVNVMDTPGSVDVITADFIGDSGAQRMIEAAKYSAGLIEGNLPSAIDRIMIRGFQADGQTVDGFYFMGQSNLDPAVVDRFEIIKGPNSILSPTGSPGGTVNAFSKKPLFVGRKMSVNTQFDAYGLKKAVIDANDRFGNSRDYAYRLVVSGQDSDNYVDNLYTKSTVIAPSVTARFGRAQLTVVGDIARTTSVAFVGLPVDPSSGSNNDAQLLHGVPRTLGLAEEDEKRHEDRNGASAFFTTTIGDHLSVRLAGRRVTYYFDTLQFNTGYAAGAGGGGSINPLTGYYEPGVTWSGNPTTGFTSTPTPPDTRIVTRSGGLETDQNLRNNLQNDYVWDAEIKGFKTTTTAGFAYSRFYQHRTNRPATRGSYVIDNPVREIAPTFNANLNQNQITDNSDYQYYIQENLTLLNDRIVLSGGWSSYRQQASTRNLLTNARFDAQQKATTRNYGIVGKPIGGVSVYYGHSESAVPSGVTSTTILPVAEGRQDEYGVKVQLLEGRVTLTAAHFEISQNNQAQPNPANLAVPPPSPLLPAILVDRENRGWEFGVNAALTRNLSIVGNVTAMHNRDPRGVMVRSAADKSAAFLARYEFHEGSLDGLSVNVGFEHVGRRAGELSSGFTAASTPTNLIPKQPSFFLPAYTLLNAGIGYSNQHWAIQLNINNVADKKYIVSSLTRQWLWAGTERNGQLSITYKF